MNRNIPKECRYCGHCSLSSTGRSQWCTCNKQNSHYIDDEGFYQYRIGLKVPAKHTCKYFIYT